jgi:GTPase SAR1 family protein
MTDLIAAPLPSTLIRVALLGAPGSGKTAYRTRLSTGHFVADHIQPSEAATTLSCCVRTRGIQKQISIELSSSLTGLNTTERALFETSSALRSLRTYR